jgi:hypothetical protein
MVLVTGGLLLLLAARWLVRRGVLDTPVLRRRGVNLVGTRGEAPVVWLAAHLDSKSQPLPTIVRSAGMLLETAGYMVAIVAATLCAARLPGDNTVWTAAAIVTVAGAIPVLFSVVGERSPGALDNASGVATVMEAARLLGGGGETPVGLVLTDAEELGLAGARAWSRAARAQQMPTVLNCDGVDDTGGITVMYSGRLPMTLVIRIARASTACGVRFDVRRLFPGILTDSVAFAGAGAESVTFSRGTLRSLARVHSEHDDLDHLRGTGIAETALLMAETVRALSGPTEHEWKS